MNKPKKPTPISGIYLIKCIPLNKHYVGSSNNVQRRLQTHKRELAAGSHNNRLLQRDYDKYGENSFSFLIIYKDVPEDMLTAYEKVFCYKYDSMVRFKGYNDIAPTTNHKLFKEAYNDLKERGVID
jgi:group I intron endonuclease